jgi:UDP-N-acetylmuramate dehydrogenase
MLLDPRGENGRSCGSFFVNVQVSEQTADSIERAAGEPPPRFSADSGLVKLPAAWLIERAGFDRGTRRGPVGLSTKHALCVVAHEGAKARDVIAFAWEIRNRVEDIFGITLKPEPQFWGFSELDAGLPLLR